MSEAETVLPKKQRRPMDEEMAVIRSLMNAINRITDPARRVRVMRYVAERVEEEIRRTQMLPFPSAAIGQSTATVGGH